MQLILVASSAESSPTLTAEQRPVEGELLGKVLDVSDALVHGPGEVVCVVQTAQDDAGEVDGLHEVAHQRALDAHNVPPGSTGRVRADLTA